MTAFQITSLHTMWALLGIAVIVFVAEWRRPR